MKKTKTTKTTKTRKTAKKTATRKTKTAKRVTRKATRKTVKKRALTTRNGEPLDAALLLNRSKGLAEIPLDKLPNWAVNVLDRADAARNSAYHYRRNAVALRFAVRKILSISPLAFAYYDEICRLEAAKIATMCKHDTKEARANHLAIKAEIVATVDALLKSKTAAK